MNIEPERATAPATVPASVPDLAASLIRTWVPIGVGAVLAWVAATTHTVLPAHASATVGIVSAGIAAGWWYGLARALEHTRLRVVGRWMLGGIVAVPRYVEPTGAVEVTP